METGWSAPHLLVVLTLNWFAMLNGKLDDILTGLPNSLMLQWMLTPTCRWVSEAKPLCAPCALGRVCSGRNVEVWGNLEV